MYHKMKSRREVEFTIKDFHDRFLSDKKFLRLHKKIYENPKLLRED